MTNKSATNDDSNDNPPRFLSAYTKKNRVRISFTGPGRTKQSFKNECDINTIMSRYQKTGILPDMLNTANAQYLDVTGYDYQEAMQIVAGAQSMFNELPSAIRSRFKNDPAEFVEFTSNPENRQEMAQMGLLRPEAVAAMANPAPASATAQNASNPAPLDNGAKTS